MKRLVKTLAILLVVIVVGLSALILLINPNDFKHYMIKQVASRSGYHLKLDGDLRWHVWPRLSILGGQMSLRAAGASEVAVRADNIRLDVNFWPLFSHRLVVNQILLDNAVVRLLPDSQASTPKGAPVAPEKLDNSDSHRGWSLDVNYLKLVNSLVIWQDPDGNQINFRDINLELTQPQPKQAQVVFSGTLFRNQQQLALQITGQLDARNYPQQLSFKGVNVSYTLSGLNLPADGFKGQLRVEGGYLPETQQFDFNDIVANVHHTEFRGKLQGHLLPYPLIKGELNTQYLDLDHWIQLLTPATSPTTLAAASGEDTAPVAVMNSGLLNEQWMEKTHYDFHLRAEQANWQHVVVDKLDLIAEQADDILNISRFNGSLAGGHFSVPMQINWQEPTPVVEVKPVLEHINMDALLKLAQLPANVHGNLSLHGQFKGTGLGVQSVLNHWNGQANVTLDDFSTSPLDLKTIFTNSIEHNNPRLKGPDLQNTAMPVLAGNISLAEGLLKVNHLSGHNAQSEFDTMGQINLPKKTLDLTFNLKMSGWNGDAALARLINNHSLPLRLYGNWDNINYNLSVNQLLDADVKTELRQRLQQWSRKTSSQGQNQ